MRAPVAFALFLSFFLSFVLSVVRRALGLPWFVRVIYSRV